MRDTLYNNTNGVYIRLSSKNTISENIVSNNDHGIRLTGSSLGQKTENNIISENTITKNNNNGILITPGCRLNIISTNNITQNNFGVKIKKEGPAGSNNNLIYNNKFNNTNNAKDQCNNRWNITKTPGTNIIDGPFLGGNYWGDYSGYDVDGDGLGDTLLPYNCSENITNGGDWHPLTEPRILGDLDHDGDIDLSDLAQLLAHYGTTSGATYEMGDIDGDGDVDLEDLAILLSNYGYGTSSIPGDLDHDGDVDLADLAQLLTNYGMTNGATWEDGDIDGDGDVDLFDLVVLLANYGYGT